MRSADVCPVFLCALKCDTWKVSPVDIIAELGEISSFLSDNFSKLRVHLREAFSVCIGHGSPGISELFLESSTVISIDAQHAVNFKANLLDRVNIKSVRESLGSQLLLLKREISTLDWRYSVGLLPCSKVVLVTGREEAHHLCLHAENTSSNERGLHLNLVYIVVRFEKRGINGVTSTEFSSNKILLSLTKRS